MNSGWFFKTARFIQFILKNDAEERDSRVPLKEDMEWFRVFVNGHKVKFIRYDI